MRESEYRKNIMDYLRKNMKKGYPAESLRWALVDQGYSRTAIDNAIKEITVEMERMKTQIEKEKPVITHEIIEDPESEIPQKSLFRRFFGL